MRARLLDMGEVSAVRSSTRFSGPDPSPHDRPTSARHPPPADRRQIDSRNVRLPDDHGLYFDLFRVTRKYLSDISVQAAMTTALDRRGLASEDLSAENLPGIVADAMVGLRLFCKPEQSGDLMMDLTELCEELSAKPGPRPPN